jgi:ParB/RepB/Spo0J family partition protein
MTTILKNIPIDQLVEPWIFLRLVDTTGIEFAELHASIRDHGLLSSIAVRESTRKPGKYEVIDGMWRLTACKDLEWGEMPCIIKEATDEQVLALQLSANAIRPETKPCEFAKQLKRIQQFYFSKHGEEMTLAKLSSMVNKSTGWLSQQLNLNKLDAKSQKMVDRGEIPVSNAIFLAKIPKRFRKAYLDRAKVMKVDEFKVLALGVIKQYREAVKQGKVDAFWTDDFKAQPYIRSLVHLLEELDTHNGMVHILSKLKNKDPPSVWIAALKWAMHMDEDSVREQEEAARGRSRKQFNQSLRERIE